MTRYASRNHHFVSWTEEKPLPPSRPLVTTRSPTPYIGLPHMGLGWTSSHEDNRLRVELLAHPADHRGAPGQRGLDSVKIPEKTGRSMGLSVYHLFCKSGKKVPKTKELSLCYTCVYVFFSPPCHTLMFEPNGLTKRRSESILYISKSNTASSSAIFRFLPPSCRRNRPQGSRAAR